MNEQTAIFGSAETGRLGVRHLKRFWARSLAKRGGRFVEPTEKDWRFDNLVLNGLGLPLEETTVYLMQFAPDRENPAWL